LIFVRRIVAMKIGAVAESTMESLALSSNLAPTPLLETQVAFTTTARARRVARALVGGGVYAIGDFLRASAPGAGGGMPAVMDLYFALTSASGTWSADEMASWQRDAGLVPREPILLQSIPGWASLPAERPK
jgi:hypothetical protein